LRRRGDAETELVACKAIRHDRINWNLPNSGKLGKYLKKYQPILIAYCLMPNHFHLILKEVRENAIAKCLHALQTSYAKAVNYRYSRSGHLFQDTYRKIIVKNEVHLVYLSRYLHLNPVRTGLVRTPEDWKYSSYCEYIGLRKKELIHPETIISLFSCVEEYREHVLDGMIRPDLDALTLE
jgi:REP element-mobilizing transposase RayT